jgi:tetratricopeptide (TPR) repeat protein
MSTGAVRRSVVAAASLVAFPLFAQGSAVGGGGARFFEDGRAALQSGHPETAAELLEKAVTADPSNSAFQLWLGRAYGAQASQASLLRQGGLARKARVAWERAVALDPENLEARESLITYYAQAPGFMGGSTEKAHEQAEEIRKRDPIRGLLHHAVLYEHEKKHAEAERMYAAAAHYRVGQIRELQRKATAGGQR